MMMMVIAMIFGLKLIVGLSTIDDDDDDNDDDTNKLPIDDWFLSPPVVIDIGLGWMMHQESTDNCGGILADEMGKWQWC